jgi:hypothetical protein
MKNAILISLCVFTCLIYNPLTAQVPFYVPKNGLVGWWPFNGNANDESGNGNNGTVSGANLTADRFGNISKAYSFNGVNTSITVSDNNNLDILGEISISFWFKKNKFNNKYEFIIGKEAAFNQNQNNYKMQFAANDNNLAFFTYPRGQSGCYPQNNCTSLLNTENWFHVVGVSRADSIYFYLNGNLVWSSKTLSTQTLPTNNASLMFGKTPYSDPNQLTDPFLHYDGKLDDIGIWNRALSQQEISDLYNANICYQKISVTDTLVINMGITRFDPVSYSNSIKIFPNPSKDHITVDYGNLATLTGYQLRITNSQGQQMFQTIINQKTSYISLASWTGNGLYFVHILDSQGNTIDIRKIVLQ